MKKLFFFLLATFMFGNYCSAQQDRTPVTPIDGGDSVACSDFNISVSILVVSVSTTVYVCCGGPFVISPTVPCSVVPKRTYDMWTGQNRGSAGNAVLVSDLLYDGKTNWQGATYLDVTNSSKATVKGKQAAIKKGRYPIDSKGYVYLELEYL
ncbi:hypothetical protein HUK80_10135 [Flavobacterium sp. MAH-1]|uniref:Uncharacterized protein n=1 Tax=Flavobacterium agri TaxID=2743471 RepID=A0A7Y8Y3J2_9FLAO|nr:hypothetical protein [Flavobacterium agri]NUY81254.1 hypothetical protein [Flavobacterium agri]NYA71278.1 hypothetical protein [Flavobacterium agri]